MSNHLAACKITTAEIERLRAENAALREIAQRYVDECDEEFHDPEAMSPSCVRLYHDAKAALAKRGEGAEPLASPGPEG